MDDVIINGLVTDFIAVMKRIGELDDSEVFLDALDEQPILQNPAYMGGMEAISVYFGGE